MKGPSKLWRYSKPINDVCRVLFAGPHFHAALPFTRSILERKQEQDVLQGMLGPAKQGIELLYAPTPKDILRLAPSCHVAIPFMEKFDESFIAVATELRLILQFGVGLEGVNIEKATQNGIIVSNIPAHKTGNAEATAEHAVFLTMSLLRRTMDELPKRFANGELGGLPIPRTVMGKRVTVVGYGAVGSKVCEYLSLMGAQVTAVRKRQWSDSETNTTQATTLKKSNDLNSVLPSTDVLILACNLTPETYHLINADRIRRCRKGILIVNVGRGPLVCYDALYEGLQSEHVEAFASDVGIGRSDGISTKPSEPWDPHDPLSLHSRTLFTPHVGGYTDYTYRNMAQYVCDAILDIVNGLPPNVWVNKDP